jgi:DNA ligase 1
MQFSRFAQQYLQPLEATSKKLEQTDILAKLFADLSADEIAPAVYLLLGQLGPVFRNVQCNFGVEFMLYALANLHARAEGHTTTSEQTDMFGGSVVVKDVTAKAIVKKEYKKLGDMGQLAQNIRSEWSGQPRSLSIVDVFDRLLVMARVGGEGSQEDKMQLVEKLLSELDPLSCRFVARVILGSTRLGFSDRTILDALSWWSAGDKTLRERLDLVYQRHPDVGRMALAYKQGGMPAVEKLDAEIGVPILPALCDRLKSADEMIAKMGEVIVEPKYDGTRVQIHYNHQTGELHTFTRNLEESTLYFPELVAELKKLGVQSVILDCEAVGYDPETDQLVSFQVTIKRKRKHDIAEMAAAIPLHFYIFDILLLNGQSLLHLSLLERKQQLRQIFKNFRSAILVMAPLLQTTSADELRDWHRKQLAAGLEGVVVKRVGSPYQPGRQDFTWVKFKEIEGTGAKLSDTIDAVVLGYYVGKGKRTTFGVGAFLIGIFNPHTQTVVTLAKIGTGLSDEQWRELKQRADDILKNQAAADNEYPVLIPETLQPDVSLPLSLVVEVAADEITQSPLHTAGVALRFPRLVRFRDDKRVADITTLTELEKIHVAQ